MTLHVTCFCIKIAPLSAKPKTDVVTLPADFFEEPDEAWSFARNALSDFLPKDAELENKFIILDDDDNEESGYFFSCSDPASDDHYHVLLKYSIF